MSLKIKIDLKKQKIFSSSNMSNKEVGKADDLPDKSAGLSDTVSSTQVTSSDTSSAEISHQLAVSSTTNESCVESVSDADDPPAIESVSDADDKPVMQAVSDVDDPPAMEAVSDADDVVEAVSDADDLPAMETSDDPFTVEVVSKEDETHSMEIASDVELPVVGDIISKDSSSDKEDDISANLTVDVEMKNSSAEIVQTESKTLSSLSVLDGSDVKLKTGGIGDASKSESDKVNDANVKVCSDRTKKIQESGENLSLKTSVSSVQAEFSDNEENMELSPQNKLLEVIFKEEEGDEDNMSAFIPEVQCTVEDGEENSGELAAGSALNKVLDESENKIMTSTDTILTSAKHASVVEGADNERSKNEAKDDKNEVEDTCEDDAYLDATGDYSAESCDVDETMQTYAKEFLYSDTSSLGPPEADATGTEEGKRLHLSRFPKIVKSVAATDYSLLQELYKLLYLRNPWDTKEVLSARILDFTGFHFAQDSEDYFNREVILRGMPQKTLESIAHLLCLPKPISARSNKQRVSLGTRIMKFLKSLEKPKRSRPASNSSSKAKPAAAVKQVAVSETSLEKDGPAKPTKSRSRKSVPSRLIPKSGKQADEVQVKVESVQKESPSVSVTERNISPGKMKWADLALPEVKVELTKMDLSDIRKATKLKVNLDKPSTPSDETSSTDSTSKPSKPEADDATDTDNSEFVLDEEVKKLKEFPEVLSNIEGTPEKILSDIHYLLYLEDASLKDLKSNVMEFRGFPVEDGPNEIEERKQFLEKMSDDVIKNLTDTFYLKFSNDKEENINRIIKFLRAPSKRHMKEAAEAPDKMLSERNADLMDGLSDSDDSITCEIVQKKVDCIDLISSGEEDEKEEKETIIKVPVVAIKKEEEEEKEQPPPPVKSTKRCLRDFETITKIVNTHPHEYLIDIFNLLYQRACEPSTLRKEILEFTGFDFEKGAEEYVKRKQYLDRMQYNNVRRIFNTLIHNTRDVRVFSKPTMIGEIFQFLFKLPETDTSIRPPPQKSNVVVPVTPKEKEKPSNDTPSTLVNVVNKADPPQAPNNTRLSELKRVFQRVACFPCEYLVDVHKLLFMKDCDMKDIRQNIFAFKGFPFGVDSQEFKQRKMYLEYLTFHSLRKISSVLTTKNVDLRNSTKHELSTHLTKVLTEYTNTYMEAEAQEASSQAEEITAQANKAAAAAAQDPGVEKIVVTPVIEGFQAASTNDATLPKVVDIRSQSKEVSPKSKSSISVTTSATAKSNVVSTSSASTQRKKAKKSPASEKPITQTFEKIIIPTVDQPAKQRRRKKANPAQRISAADALTKAEQMGAAMQFQDIHLPEVESLVRSYQQNPSLMSTLCPRPQPPSAGNLGNIDSIRSNIRTMMEQKAGGPNIYSPVGTTQFPLQMSYPQIRPNFAPPNVTVGMPPRPSVPLQIIRPFSMQPPVQNVYYNQSLNNPNSPPLEPIYKDDEPGDFVGTLPVECILTEGGSGEPASKKLKLAQLLTSPPGCITVRNIPQPTQPVQPMKKLMEHSKVDSSDRTMKPSTSFHLKIRDAMTKASEDEEDCDKPLATLVGHPNDKVLKQQICEIVENTDLQDITINGVIQKIFNMYPKFNLNYRKEFIKSTLRSLLYRLGEQEASKSSESNSASNPDSSVSDQSDSKPQISSPTKKVPSSWS